MKIIMRKFKAKVTPLLIRIKLLIKIIITKKSLINISIMTKILPKNHHEDKKNK